MASTTVGGYLAARLSQVGVGHFFTVPGDYNLVLLDELLKNPNLQMIGCCNELNAGYAADGYARATGGPAAVVVTFSVGGLSALNAVAGACAEDLPVIAISGGPNTNSQAEFELLHHTMGVVDYDYQRDIFSHVTAEAVIIQHADEAPRQIDQALEAAVRRRKPVYLEVACNIAGSPTSAPNERSFHHRMPSDEASMSDAVEHAAEMLNAAVKPVLVAGVKLRPFAAQEAFLKLADAAGYAVAAMPNAKGFVSEHHPGTMGTYWGPVSSPGCCEIVESADCCLFAGPTLTDYTTVGRAAIIDRRKLIAAGPDSVNVAGQSYSNVHLRDFLERLAPKLAANDRSLVAFNRIRTRPEAPDGDPSAPLTTRQLFARIQKMIDAHTAVIAETGDSWFNGMQLDLPAGSRFEIQMQYGSIGWSVGATLGYAVGSPERRVVSLIGDGSFQLTAQEVSTMIRYGVKPIIFLINNGGYTIEVEIHDGPYNTIKNWDYAALVDAFAAGEGNASSCRVTTAAQLDAAIGAALAHDGLSLIEVVIDRDDCSDKLLEWGRHVARNNGRPPRHD